MSTPARDHHFVPQFYLRRWADNGAAQVMAYRTVVSRAEVPEWTPRSIKGVAFHRDLYAVLSSPELDEFERWIATEFEEPARETLDRVVNGGSLTARDHERLGSFFAAQDVRTPASFFESQERWAIQIPETFEQTLNKAVAKLEAAHQAGTKLQPLAPGPNPFADAVRIRIEPHDEGRSAIRVRVASGRAFWIAQMRSLLTGKGIAKLQSHKWSIVEPHGTAEWFTSDHPAMRLNFYNIENYDFGGGWGRENCDLFLPLSPRHLLYVQVGTEHGERFAFGPSTRDSFRGCWLNGLTAGSSRGRRLPALPKIARASSMLTGSAPRNSFGPTGTTRTVRQKRTTRLAVDAGRLPMKCRS